MRLSRPRYIAMACLAIVLGLTRGAGAQTNLAGYAKIVIGSAAIVRGGLEQPLKAGDPVFQGDILQTGANGQLGVTLRDDTRLALGPQTQLTVTTFAFSPADRRFGLVLRLARGILEYISGRISALAPETIRLETPSTVVGVRGTHLLLEAGAR